jgi:diadenosine tetraphosphate (Ap4A) HIT family hydrolase
MPTLFTRIIDGELPGRFVWKDPDVVAFLTIAPIAPGHTLVVPRAEIDHWIDMPPDLAAKVMDVSRKVGLGIQRAFSPARVGVMVAGLEVPHVHYHLLPIERIADLDFSKQQTNPDPKMLDDSAARLRTAMRELGFTHVAD